jgi:hypothetical protein
MYEIMERSQSNPDFLKGLNLDVSTEEFLSAERAFTYADVYDMLGNGETVAWLTPHAAIAQADGRSLYSCSWQQLMDGSCRFFFSADGKEMVVLARSLEHLLEICHVVLRLLAPSVVHSILIRGMRSRDGALIDDPNLAYLMEHCQSLKDLTLIDLAIHQNHCRVLGDYSRPDLKIVLRECRIAGAAAEALAEVLGRNQGPTKLDRCQTDNFVLANGLRGNSRLKSLTLSVSNDFDVGKLQVFAIAGALRENKGLVALDLHTEFVLSHETWDVVCDSLKTHPTLQVLRIWPRGMVQGVPLAPAVLKSRIQALVGMLEVNMSIHIIRLLHYCYSDHELFQESVVPYLEMNRFRPRVRAIQKTRPNAYRAKVLGSALLAVRTSPNRLWMFLSGNAEVAFPSTTATTTPAASFPTPATDAATVTATSTRADSTSSVSAADKVAPSAA